MQDPKVKQPKVALPSDKPIRALETIASLGTEVVERTPEPDAFRKAVKENTSSFTDNNPEVQEYYRAIHAKKKEPRINRLTFGGDSMSSLFEYGNFGIVDRCLFQFHLLCTDHEEST